MKDGILCSVEKILTQVFDRNTVESHDYYLVTDKDPVHEEFYLDLIPNIFKS